MLASLPELKERLRTSGTVAGPVAGADADAELGRLLAAASGRIVQQRPERSLEPTGTLDEPVTLTFPIVAPQRIVQVPDLRDVATLELRTPEGAVLTTPAYTLRRRAHEVCALWVRFAYPIAFDGELAIAGAWGPAGVRVGEDVSKPAAHISDAALVWAARAFHNRTARFADTMQDPAGAVASYFRNLPPDVVAVLDALEVPGI